MKTRDVSLAWAAWRLVDILQFCWLFFEKNDEMAVFFEEKKLQKCSKDDKGMRVAVELQNMFVCTLFTSSDYLVGGRLGREVGAMANTFYDKMQWLLPEAVGVLTWGRIPPGQG